MLFFSSLLCGNFINPPRRVSRQCDIRIQLLDRICDVALFMSDEELKAMSWTTFVSGCTQPELVQYLKERRLYVNEPIESEAEV